MAVTQGDFLRHPDSVLANNSVAAKDRPALADAKRLVVGYIRDGATVSEAMRKVSRVVKTYEYWMAHDAKFAEEIRIVRAIKANQNDVQRGDKASDFAEFRREYLNTETFVHQQQWIDLIEGRPPRGLHPNMVYEPGDPRFILINTAPEHSKTITLSVDYVTYRICKNPNIRIIICSKTQEMAKQMVYAVKQRLTHPMYHKLQINFAPSDGFQGGSAVWQATQVYLGSDVRDSAEKDPTLQAIGIGGQIYGARADLIILDDCVVLSNANQFESQIRWVQQEVITRTGPGARIIIAGTRVDPIDLYREIRNPDRYPDGKSPWTYLAQPAVLEYADRPEDWVTLWPKSNRPFDGTDDEPDEHGLYPRWDGPRLAQRRRLLDPKTWSMVYMQADVSEDSIFDPKMVRATVNGRRTVGPLDGSNPYHERPLGMQGLYVICGMDPAMAGETASVAYALDVKTGMRYVLEAHRMRAPSPAQIKDLIKTWTVKYGPMRWVIEKNAFQLYLTRDEEIRDFLANRGVAMVEHYTSTNKLDPDFGVASLAPLFTESKISLPSSHNCEGVKALIEQLVTWRPGIKGSELKQDLPMALWFCELQGRQVIEQAIGRVRMHRNDKYIPRYRRAQQYVVSLDDTVMEDV